MENNERRIFSRITFEAETSLQQHQNLWRVDLIDISLKGLLINKPADWDGLATEPYDVRIHLSDSIGITMTVAERHQTDHTIGFECLNIDLDSIAHLRRLVEFNLGDTALLERELAALGQ